MPWLSPAGISAVLPTPVTAPSLGEVKAGLGAGATLALVPESLEQDLAAWLLQDDAYFIVARTPYHPSPALPAMLMIGREPSDEVADEVTLVARQTAGGVVLDRLPGRIEGRCRAWPTKPGDRRDCRAEGTGEAMTVIYEKLAVIGMGLIGSSIALAARRAGAVGHIVGCDADPDVMPEVEKGWSLWTVSPTMPLPPLRMPILSSWRCR